VTSGNKRYQLSRRQAWFANPRTDADGNVRPGAHLAAIQARIAAEAAGTARPEVAPTAAASGQWNPLGPAGVGYGQADGRPRVSGRVTAIAVHPDGQRAYIGTANGGTWYTDDAGLHWRCLDTYAETAPLTGRSLGQSDALSVGAIAVMWDTQPSGDVVYVGTGEPNGGWDSFFGIGVRVATGPAAANPLDPDPTVPTWTLEATALAGKAIYALALDPDPGYQGVVYAATTVGLWRRTVAQDGKPSWAMVFNPAVPSPGCSWLSWLDDTATKTVPGLYVTDVVIAPASDAHPQTIYLAVQDATSDHNPQQVWASQSGDTGSWQAVPGYTATDRIALAVSPSDPTVVYALSRGKEPPQNAGVTTVPTNVARLVNGTFQPITAAPVNLAGIASKSQAFYDTVIAVDPVDPSVIWLGGSAQQDQTTNRWNASLFRGAVTAGAGAAAGTWSFGFLPGSVADPTKDPSFVGPGAHPDVHALVFSGPAATPTVWLGCDGGVFQCQVVTPAPPNAKGTANGTAPGPWQPLNNGLAITQPNYLAQTKVSDFLMLAGTQDNGAQEHTGSAVWTLATLGDGGGCAIDDSNSSRRFVQYIQAGWMAVGSPGRAYVQTLDYDEDEIPQPLRSAWQTENKYSAFYSQAAARPLASLKTALAFGSYRVWYCEDWGQTWAPGNQGPDSWRTLPTGTNPIEKTDAAGNPAPDQGQDSLHSQVVRVSFADDDHLLVLAQAWPQDPTRPDPRPAALYLLTRAGPPWNLAWLSPPDPGQPAPPAPPAGAANGFPAGQVPLGLAVDQPGPPPTCYVTLGASQDTKNPSIDHVWWYDGAHWWGCKFDQTVADTPVNAVVVDADRTVYVGTDVGVWKGVPDTAGAAKQWQWTLWSNGLPEAPVLDLLLSQNPHLLRAATHGRGVWELNLDETAPVTQTYLRAHVADTRRVTPASTVFANWLFGPPPSEIDASPDIVISGPANPAPPADLPLFKPPRPQRSESVRVLQYALRRRQTAEPPVPPELGPPLPLLAVDGVFGQQTKQVVEAFQANTPGLAQTGQVQAADWQAIVTASYIDALAGADATYLDMTLLDRINPIYGPSGGPSLVALPVNAEVYVQVNARGWQRRPAGSVNIGLLATPSFDITLATLPPLPADWVAQFKTAVSTPPATWLTGSASWAWIGSPATMATPRPLHPEEPQVVRFTVTFPLPSGAPTLPVQWTLLAFADDPLDRLNTVVTSVHDLVLNDAHAAVRSVTLFA
jgi:hypothetical protein